MIGFGYFLCLPYGEHIKISHFGSFSFLVTRQCGYAYEAMDPISCQAIYKWQHGLSLPSVDNLVILSELFHVPMDQIIIRESLAS